MNDFIIKLNMLKFISKQILILNWAISGVLEAAPGNL